MSSFGDATTIGILNVLGYSDLGDEITAYAEGTGDSCNATAWVRSASVFSLEGNCLGGEVDRGN